MSGGSADMVPSGRGLLCISLDSQTVEDALQAMDGAFRRRHCRAMLGGFSPVLCCAVLCCGCRAGGGGGPPDDGDGKSINVKGRDMITGLPKELSINQRQIAEALAEPVAQIIDTIKRALEQTPAELAADIVERGIMMTGGGSLLGNLDKVLRRSTSLPVSIAEDPLLCVVMGTGKALEEKSKLSDVFASD